MTTLKKTLILAAVLLGSALLTLQGARAAGPYQVITNEANAVASLSRKDITAIMLKRETTWDDGVAILPIDQSPDSEVRKEFSGSVLGRTVGAVKAYWQNQIFSGRGVPPPEVSDDAAVLDYVKKNPGAIGYVSANAGTEGVKVISIAP